MQPGRMVACGPLMVTYGPLVFTYGTLMVTYGPFMVTFDPIWSFTAHMWSPKTPLWSSMQKFCAPAVETLKFYINIFFVYFQGLGCLRKLGPRAS
jgi:hypothetical protein